MECIILDQSITGIMDSKPAKGMIVCLLFSVLRCPVQVEAF